jgi:broad specificity phosphatase PhoE
MIRHAETEDNKNKVVSGSASTTILTEEGRRQAIDMQLLLTQMEPPINRVVTSEMHRTKDTAKLLCDCDSMRHLPHSQDKGINERNYGVAEGMSDKDREKLKAANGGTIAGQESKDALRARTVYAIVKNLQKDGVPLFVTHGGNIKRVLEHTLGKNTAERELVTNCTLYEFVAPQEKGEGWKVNVLELDDNKEIKRHNFGERTSKVSRLVSGRNEREIGNIL